MVVKKNEPNIKQKSFEYPDFTEDDFTEFDNMSDPYYLDASLRKEIKDKNIKVRFLNENWLKKFGGRHKSGWRAYRREDHNQTVNGESPDRYVRRAQDLILGYMPMELFGKLKASKDKLRKEASVSERLKRQKAAVEAKVRGIEGISVEDTTESKQGF